jgi:hypothetical protein
MAGICHISETQEAEYLCSGSISLSGCGRKGLGKRWTTFEGQSSANFIQHGGQKKGKTKVVQTTNFKKKEKKLNMSGVESFVCGKTRHFAKKCTERKGKKNQQGKNNSANMVVSEAEAIGYGNTYTVLTACQSIE